MRTKKVEFTHLRVYTDYSLLDSLVSIEKLLDLAQERGDSACAITDMANMFGVVEFYEEAKKRNIKPILGSEISIERACPERPGGSVVFLARDSEGYRNLMKIASVSHIESLEGKKSEIGRETLKKYSGGLIVLSGGANSEIARLLMENREKEAETIALEYRDVFGEGNFYLELQDTRLDLQEKLNAMTIELAKKTGIPTVLTCPVHYLRKEDAEAYRVLCLSREDNKASKDHCGEEGKGSTYYKRPDEIKKKFSFIPEAIENTVKIAERCNVDLDLGKVHLPKFPGTAGKTNEEFFEDLVREGVYERYGKGNKEAISRMEHELSIIKDTETIDYFLMVWDFINYARKQAIPIGPGRGAAPGSIVNYALGITEVDPLKYGLIFERFLSSGGGNFPEIVTDFGFERRDEIIEYVTQKYTKENIANIITFGKISPRTALRYAGRGLGVSEKIVKEVINLLPKEVWYSCKMALECVPELEVLCEKNKEIKRLFEVASRFEGHYNQSSKHVAGMVISDKPLRERIPLFRTEKGDLITGFSTSSLEKAGMLKMDFLGLRALTHIDSTVSIVNEKQGVDISMKDIPLDDTRTYDILGRGDTDGVFQLEAATLREILKRLRPKTIGDISGLLALFKPSTIKNGLLEDFAARKRYVYGNEILDGILEETGGLVVYQEQVMRILAQTGGFSMDQANSMRKAISRQGVNVLGLMKDLESIENIKDMFLEGGIKRGVPKKEGLFIWKLLKDFGPCAFSKAHVTAYAIISYRTAYLKANYRQAFDEAGRKAGICGCVGS